MQTQVLTSLVHHALNPHPTLKTLISSHCSVHREHQPSPTGYTMGFEKIEDASLRDSLDFTIMRSVDLTNSLETKNEDKQQKSPLEESFIDKIKNFGTNVRFAVGGLGQRALTENSLWMLGKHYTSPNAFLRDFETITWCSYRRNFPRLLGSLPATEGCYTNDTNWGCMIRASQMMFCEVLKRKLKHRFVSRAQLNKEIIRWIIDGENAKQGAPYSIQSICDELHEAKHIKPGHWFKASEILLALRDIHRKYGANTVNDLEMAVFVDGTIYLDQILDRVCSEPQNEFLNVTLRDNERTINEVIIVDECEAEESIEEIKQAEEKQKRPLKPASILSLHDEDSMKLNAGRKIEENFLDISEYTNSCIDDFIDEKQKLDENHDAAFKLDAQMKSSWTKSIFFVVLVKVGLDEVNPEYIPCVKELLSYPQSVGMIGGRPGNAYYFVGCQNNELIYLDPHFVQDACLQKKDLPKYINSYSYSQPRTVPLSKIDTSIGVGFYIDNANDFANFLDRLTKTQKKNSAFFGVERFTPLLDELDDHCSLNDSESRDYSKDCDEDYDVLSLV